MLAVLLLAAISRSCRALAIAGPSFSAVARGLPSIGAIVTLALSRNSKIGAPRRGTSSANGCGSGWHAPKDMTAMAAVARMARRAAPLIAKARRRWPADRARKRRRTGSGRALGAGRIRREHNCRETAPVGALAAQAAAPVAEEIRRLGGGVAPGTLDRRDAGPSEPVLDIVRQIEHEMTGPGASLEGETAGQVFGEEPLRKFRPHL